MADLTHEEEMVRKKDVMDAGIYLREGQPPTSITIARVNYLAEMLASGRSDSKVRKYITTEYEVKDERTIESYMAAAYRLITPTDWTAEKERLAAKNIKTLQTIIDKTLDKEQYKVAREAIDSLNKMLGLTGGNSVLIAKDDKGNEAIKISFD